MRARYSELLKTTRELVMPVHYKLLAEL